MAKAALYARASSSGQTVENQIRELKCWAERAGHEIVATCRGNAISGGSRRLSCGSVATLAFVTKGDECDRSHGFMRRYRVRLTMPPSSRLSGRVPQRARPFLRVLGLPTD